MAMTAEQVTKKAKDLMTEHGLDWPAWGFRLTRHKLVVGRCEHHYHGGGMILFSKNYLGMCDEEIIDTILHEIAHALCGPGAGHGPVWQAMCVRIGAKPYAKVNAGEARPEWKWTGICPNDPTHHVRRHALTERGKTVACGRCCKEFNEGEWSIRFKYEWHLTEDLKTAGRVGVRIINRPEVEAQQPTRISEIMAAGF